VTLPEKVKDVTQTEWLEVRERLAAAESRLALAMTWGAEVYLRAEGLVDGLRHLGADRDRCANERDRAEAERDAWIPVVDATVEALGAEVRGDLAEAARRVVTERDEAQRDWEREHERLAAREAQIERAHAHTRCEREWTNLHDLGDCLTHAVADMAGALGVTERDLNEVRAFLRRTAAGGSIISDAAMTATQIAIAQAAERMLVTPDGYGFVYVPGPSLQPGDESATAERDEARADGLREYIAQISRVVGEQDTDESTLSAVARVVRERDEAQRGRTSVAAVNAALRDYPDADVSALWVPVSEALEYQHNWHRDVAKGRAALEKAEADLDAMRDERDRLQSRIDDYPKNVARLENECARLDARAINACVARNEAEADLADARRQLAAVMDALRACCDGFEDITVSRSECRARNGHARAVLAAAEPAARAHDEAVRAEALDEALRCAEDPTGADRPYQARNIIAERIRALGGRRG